MSTSPFAGVIPCAGRSERMGRSKALMDAGGVTFLERVTSALRDGGCDRVLVVVRESDGPEADEARRLGAEVIGNPDPSAGPISSLRAALALLVQDEAVEGVLSLPVDHPLVRADTVGALIAEATPGGPSIVLPRCGERRGHPALFQRTVWDELLDPDLEGGARTVVRRDSARVREVEVDDPGVLADIDHPGAYRGAFPGSTLHAVSPADAAAAVVDSVEQGHAMVVCLRPGPTPRRRISQVGPAGTLLSPQGSLGESTLDDAADELASQVARGERAEGSHELLGEPVYVELHHPAPDLLIVGAGHIAQPLAEMGALLGFRVIVADDRPEFATRERFPSADLVQAVDFQDPFATLPLHGLTHLVLVTRGHKYDYECLRRVLLSDVTPRYIGMIGSRRRVRATYQQLVDEGIPRDRLSAVRAPVGLDLGAETPAEIAVAVVAEMVLAWRGGTGSPLHESERILDRFFKDTPEETVR